MRILNKLDPVKPPPLRFVAAHVAVLWQLEIEYLETAIEPPPPLDLTLRPWDHTGVLLGAQTAPGWLADGLARLVPVVRELCSDLAMRDWLVETAGDTNDMKLREAALLTKHLGLTDQLPAILDRAERIWAMHEERDSATGERVVRFRDPMFGSHRAFLRFLDRTNA
jgi:hypothetical protein